MSSAQGWELETGFIIKPCQIKGIGWDNNESPIQIFPSNQNECSNFVLTDVLWDY